ncbi:hypothetical protein HAX54_007263, partial [Datura stramonium]|nr:hypothetical protein [Datura stramonium]
MNHNTYPYQQPNPISTQIIIKPSHVNTNSSYARSLRILKESKKDQVAVNMKM